MQAICVALKHHVSGTLFVSASAFSCMRFALYTKGHKVKSNYTSLQILPPFLRPGTSVPSVPFAKAPLLQPANEKIIIFAAR